MLRQYELVERVKRYDPEADEAMINRAYVFSVQKHGSQKRASGDPYFSHPIEVAGILTDFNLDDQTIVTALLHDTIEDTLVTYDEIESAFGRDVARMVDGVTKLSKIEAMSENERAAENLRKFLLAMSDDIRVLLVKLADRLHNMRTLHFRKKASSRERTARETMDIYGPLARRVGLYQIAAEMEDLAFQELNPEARRAILYRQDELALENADDLERIRGDLEQLMEVSGIPCRIKGRRKQPYSLWRKLEKKSISFRDVADLFAFRVIVESVEDCYRVLGEIHRLWACIPDRFRDYISVPKPNGYASLHTTVRASGNRRVELQIRTEEMDRTAEFGVAAHWGYKNRAYGFDIDSARAAGLDPAANLEAFAELLQDGGDPSEFMEHAKLEMYREHVFAFSPKGKLIILPAGAMPLDFAYAVHTKVGNQCVAARIDGKLAALSTPLESGQTVKIITAPNATPNPAWLNFVVTGKARTNIRHFLKHQRREDAVELGERLLEKALHSYDIGMDELPIERVVSELAGNGYVELDDLLEDIGMGNRLAPLVARKLAGARDDDERQHEDDRRPLAIRGSEGLMVSYAKCCLPLPGDTIIGHLSAGRGIVVHRDTCKNLLAEMRNAPEKCIALSWDKQVEQEFTAALRIELINKRGVLATLANSVSELGSNIDTIDMAEKDPTLTSLNVTMTVKDRIHLARIIKKLRTLDSIVRIHRL